MVTTIMFSPLKFSLRNTKDHHGLYTFRSFYLIAKIFYCSNKKIAEFEIFNGKTSSTAYVILHELIDLWVFDSNRRVGEFDYPHGAGTSSPSDY